MNTEFDYDLTRDQWEALKTLRLPAPNAVPGSTRREPDRAGTRRHDRRLSGITPKGRSVLLRGSPRLWDVAA